MTGPELAEAARAMIGTPFRLHGRDPATGVDCVGLLAASMARCGRTVTFPTGYRLRTRAFDGLEAVARAAGLENAEDQIVAGDVLVVQPGPLQMHLVIALTGRRCVHAHAGLRKVVAGPIDADWALLSQWRCAP